MAVNSFRKKFGRLKKALVGAVLSISITLPGATVFATTPFEGYNYDYWTNSLNTPLAYVPETIITGEQLGVGNFSNPADVYVRDDIIYMLDSGLGRIVIFDRDLTVHSIIESYTMNGEEKAFNGPQGIFVTEEGLIYVADTENMRVVVLDQDGSFVKSIETPTSDLLPVDFDFRPVNIAVDRSGRLYVIARNVFEGIMCFNNAGEFYGYFGTIKVSFNPLDWFWRSVATKEQRAQLRLFIPTEFSGLDIDHDGFIYATNVDRYSSEQAIKKLNPKGQDVIVNYNANKRLNGDFLRTEVSVFRDIKYRGDGIYSAMDFNKGRIFTYDSEGNLLYVFGGIGTAVGMAKKPVAVEAMSDDTMLILDQDRGALLFFQTTVYGSTINEAIRLRFNGDEASAVELWEKVLDMDANNQLAYIGIGKSYLSINENKLAMEYLKKGMDVTYYSVAYKRYRNDVLRQNLPILFTGAMVAVLGYAAYKILMRKKSKGGVEA